MEICLVGDAQSPHVRSRAEAISKSGHLVRIVSERGAADVVDGVVSPEKPREKCTFPLFSLTWQLRSLIRRDSSQLINIHYAHSLGAWAVVLARPDKPVIVTAMGGDVLYDEQSNPSYFERWMTSQVWRRANAVTAKSELLRERIIPKVGPDCPVETVVWGVDTQLFSPSPPDPELRDRYGIPAGSRILLSPRPLRPLYNHDLIVRGLHRLIDRYPEVHLVICEYETDAKYKDEIRHLIDRLGLTDAVTFVGVVDHKEMPKLYNLASIVIGIPRSDGFPQSALEALACEKPAILGDLERYAEILEDGRDAVFTTFDDAALASKVSDILEDKELAERLGRNGRETVIARADLAAEAVRVAAIFSHALDVYKSDEISAWRRICMVIILLAGSTRSLLRTAYTSCVA